MHTITVTFEDKEFEELKRVKEEHNLNWHDFVLKAQAYYNDIACEKEPGVGRT